MVVVVQLAGLAALGQGKGKKNENNSPKLSTPSLFSLSFSLSPPLSSERSQDLVSRRHSERPSFLQVEQLDRPVLDQGRIPPRADAQALVGEVELGADGLGEQRASVGQEQDLVARVDRAAPRVHHEGIVDGDAGDGVDALGAELVRLLDEAGEVLEGAGRGEGALKEFFFLSFFFLMWEKKSE